MDAQKLNFKSEAAGSCSFISFAIVVVSPLLQQIFMYTQNFSVRFGSVPLCIFSEYPFAQPEQRSDVERSASASAHKNSQS